VLLIIAGLFWSRALQSIGCGLVFLHPFVNGNPRSTFWRFRHHPPALLLFAYYVWIFISYFWSTDTNAWWDQNIILKLPVILVPFGLLSPNAFDKKRLTWTLWFFILAAWITGAFSFINYLSHYAGINEAITHSKPIPIITPISDGKDAYHIYFSLMLGFACLAGLYLLRENGKQRSMLAIGFLTFCNLIFLHVVGARTGLVGFYAALVAGLVYLIVARKKIVTGLIGLAIILVSITITLTLVPSMKNRLDNTRTDVNRFRTGQDINHYSVSMRLEALKTAWKVFKHSPIIGTGAGDVRPAMEKQYEEDHTLLEIQNRHLPHNQFAETAMMLGLIGAALLILMFLWPSLYQPFDLRGLFAVFMVLCLVSFQFESVLERQVGLTFFVLFYILLARQNEHASV
jgi:O-antigen ligase